MNIEEMLKQVQDDGGDKDEEKGDPETPHKYKAGPAYIRGSHSDIRQD